MTSWRMRAGQLGSLRDKTDFGRDGRGRAAAVLAACLWLACACVVVDVFLGLRLWQLHADGSAHIQVSLSAPQRAVVDTYRQARTQADFINATTRAPVNGPLHYLRALDQLGTPGIHVRYFHYNVADDSAAIGLGAETSEALVTFIEALGATDRVQVVRKNSLGDRAGIVLDIIVRAGTGT